MFLGMLLQTSPAPLRALYLGSAGLRPVSLPVRSVPLKLPNTSDFNHDGVPESLALTGGHLTIFSNSQSVWQSPLDWTVVQAKITDLNQDGSAEATLLVWRAFRPWPATWPSTRPMATSRPGTG